METKLIAIICVAVLVVGGGGAAAFMLTQNNGGNSSSSTTTDAQVDVEADPLYADFNVKSVKCLMFGNANNDSYLNADDLTLLNKYVDGSETWDIKKNPLADTNADGKVTKEDADLLDKILKADSSTEQFEVKYLNFFKRVSTSLFPLKGNITVDYSTAYDMAVILDILDLVVGTRQSAEQISKLSDTLYPGLKSHLKNVTNDANRFDGEKLLANNVKIVLGDPYDTPQSLIDTMAKLDKKCTVLQLPVNRVINNIDYTHTIITLGALMDIQENTADYAVYVNNVETKVMNAIKDAHATSKTMVIAYNPSSANNIGLDCLNTMQMQYTDVMNSMKLPLTYALPPMARYLGGMYTGLEAEYLAEVNPEIIILETYNLAGADITKAEYVDIVKEKLSYINVTNAYINNNVIVIPFEVIGGTAGISTLVLMGNQIWGDAYFDETEGWNLINEYYQKFTNMGDSVDMKTKFGYAPEQYGKTMEPTA